jgi:hypothetical protein
MAAPICLLSTDRATLGTIIARQPGPAGRDGHSALAQVAKGYSASDAALASQIQQALTPSELPDLAKAYAANDCANQNK